MGWFNDLIEERKKKNQEIFDSSFNNLSKSVFGNESKEKDLLRIAISEIFKYYRIVKADIPDVFNDISSELDFILSKYNLQTRRIRLLDDWAKENDEIILAFSKEAKIPIILYPKRNGLYIYLNPETGKKAKITPEILEKLELEALTFYRPLPKTKLTIKDYFTYIRKSVRPTYIILAIFMIALSTAVGLIMPYLTKILMGEVITDVDYSLFLTVAMGMLGATVATLLIRTSQSIINARIAIRIENSLHSAVMMRLLSLPTSFFKRYNTGELNTRVSCVSLLCTMIINGVFVTGLSAVMSLAYLIQIDDFAATLVWPSLIVVAVNLLFLITLSVFERGVIQRQTRYSAKERGISYGLINGIQKIRLSGSEKRAFVKWADAYSKSARNTYNPPLIIKIAPVISVLISVAGGLLIYYLVGKHNIDQASYIAFMASYGALSAALLSLSVVFNNVVKIQPMLDMVKPILEEQPENDGNKIVLDSISGEINIDHVSFRYDEESPLIVNDLSLKIKKGEYVALVGKTGCGKSTIVRLLLGFETPNEGHIYYDNHDLSTLDLSSLRKKIGSVTQNGSLFHADILSNIIISAPELTEEDAWRAAEIANIDKDIKEMPMGMNTVISEGQGSISGGQKQRIMIARAIVHNPKLIIFDEATSALDNRCQKIVTEAIGKLNCTRLVIAHRLSTIKNCDRILYLEGGKVVEEGTYNELLKLNGKFKELIERQKIED